MSEYHLGLRLDLEPEAKAAWGSGRDSVLKSSRVFTADNRPLPDPGFSLAQWVLWWFNQGQIGTCAGNAGTGATQTANIAAFNEGELFDPVQLSRAFVYYNARKFDGLIGRGDGATCSGIFRAASEIGMCRENSLPYRVNARYLDTNPPQAAFDEAKDCKLLGIIDVDPSNIELRKRSIFNGHPVFVGIDWPAGWDEGLIDKYGRTTGTGRPVGGHALYDIGWVIWDGKLYWHRVNSHGPIYPCPPAEIQKSIVGYACARPKDNRCYSFWVRHDLDMAQKGRNCEYLSMTGMSGFTLKNPLAWKGVMS